MDNRQLPQQDGIEHAEYRCIRPNHKHQSGHRNRGKSRILQQHPDSVANVLQQYSHFSLRANSHRCELPATDHSYTPVPMLPKPFRPLHVHDFLECEIELAYTDTLRVPTVSSTMRPSKRWIVRSATLAEGRSCVTMQMVPPSRCSCRSKSAPASLFFESKFPVGSSASRIEGEPTSARATATRCCWPPESWEG